MIKFLTEAKNKPKKYQCDSCGAGDDLGIGWMWFNFRNLDPVWICAKCVPAQHTRLAELQARQL